MRNEISPADYSAFIVCGTDTRGKRFRICYGAGFAAARCAFAVNLFRGSVWGVRVADGKRELLKRVLN